MTKLTEKIGPASKKQEMMLNTSVDTCIIGGAMGSGKSYIALLYPLKYIDDPWFRGVVFRKTTGELTAQGGLWETAIEIYSQIFGIKLKKNKKDLKITFPSGASLKFSHMEHDDNRHQHQGAQYTFVLFDEATHFSKVVIEYLGGRIRSAKARHLKQMILTCNPDPDWFALDWIKPYLQPDGTPDQGKDGLVRYYAVENDIYYWADSKEELEKKFGTGNENGVKSFTFISANCYDNPPLLENDPSYPTRLKAKPWVDVQRYLYGNWYVRPSSSGFWKRDWCDEVAEHPHPEEIEKTIRAWDIAGSLPSPLLPDPDYTVGVKMVLLKNGDFVVTDVIRFRARFGDVITKILEVAYEDGRNVDIMIPQDPGAAGKAASGMFIRDLIADGFYARPKPTNKSKIDRFRPFAAASENKMIKILRGCANDLENKIYGNNEFYYKEMEAFDGGRKGHDDLVDATGDCFISLAQRQRLPTFAIPDLSTTSRYA